MSNKTIILTENQKEILKNILLEDKEGKNLAKARHYLVSKGYSSNDAQQVLNSIRTDIPNTRMAQCKFILGAVRLYLQGQLSDGKAIHELNNTLKYIASDAHVNEYDNNLNDESLQVLVNRFKGVAKDNLRQSMAASNARQLTVNQDYTIVPINNFEESSKYGRYTSWCVTHNENMLNSYTAGGTGRFYFCLRNGFENESKVKGEGCPLDSYGLSMIAVSVDMEGAVNTITCRWNHDMGGNDSVMTVEELENLLGRNFYQTFKPYTREELHAKGIILFDEVQALLDSGKKPEDIFDYVSDFSEGFARVALNRKDNFINTECKIISDTWFDDTFDFKDGFAIVELNEKYNFINTEGKLLSNFWFDDISGFENGFAYVLLNGNWYKINKGGKIVESKNRNGKTIIITESQKKKLKKAIAAQDQVGGKVNAGVMDAVVGGGMCENVEEDEYTLGAEQNEISPYYHVTEEKLNESPDYVEALSLKFSNDDAVAFLSLSEDGRFYIGEQGETHADIIKKIDDSLYDEFMSTVGYDNICDDTMTGRYWKNDNVLSLWRTPINKRLNIRKVINELSSNGIITNSNYTLIDYWDTDDGYDLIFPVKWLFNGTFDIFNGRCTRIAPVNVNEYKNNGKYTYFSVTLQGQGTQIVNLNGNEFLTGMQYYMKTSLGEAKEHERMVDIRQIISSDRFKTWFGNSKVVDENGMPLVVHHGSPKFIGDKFNKKLTGKSMNYGEEGVFCTTQDLSWAKRFSYPASQGTSNFTVKVDYSKPGDILSGFLKIEHPLDFFHLSDKDWKNIKDIILNSYIANLMSDEKFEELKHAVLIKNHQFLKQMISGYNKDNNFGNVLKKYGYDGYIALMDKKSTAKEYCFIEPNQFKSIYSLSFNPKSDSIYEAKKKKIIKNDKGEIVPEKCKKCGGKVVCQIHGEPVYICKDCGEYYGTMPFTLKENKLNESWEDLSDICEEYSVYDLLCKFQDDKEKGITKKKWNLIPAQQYHTLLKRYMYSPEMAKIPYNVVNNWFMNIIVPNALDISYITELAGHSRYFPEEDVEEFFERYYEPIDISGFHDWSEKLEELGFYDWCVFPDGSDAWSDYGIEPLFNIINEYSPNSSAEDILILINRCLDVAHQRGDMSSGFIQGGKQSCDYISNVTESIKKRSKTLNEENTSIDKKALYLMIYAKNTYGITDNFDSCGFILLNGELLDFGNYDDIYRQSHGALDLKGTNFRDFINSGNIRVNPQSPGIEFSKEPTEKQYVKISEMIAKYEGKDAFYVDCVNNEGANIWNKAYKLEERQNIISDIKEYFNNGKTPVVKGNDVLCGYSLRDFIGENVENEIAPEDVDLSSFVIKKKLNPDFWIDGHLDSRVRMKLLDIADDFIEEIGIDTIKPIDVIMTGSLANFNWNEKYSDIDLHIVYDFSEIDDNVEFLKKYFDSKKQLWNQKHTNLKILGFNVEVYVQDINEPHMSSGVYSLDKDKWLVKPDREILASSKVNKEFIKNKCSYYTEKIDELLYLYKKAKNDKHKIEKILIKADKLFNEIKQLRKIGFEKSNGKEINNYNILFKFLRRKNYLNKLSILKTKCYDIINGF